MSVVNSNQNIVDLDASQLDLEQVLDAWHSATDRLQRTHLTLSKEIRRLTDELEVKNRELARKNRLADLGQMASHVAHECRNSLVPITLYMSLLRRRVENDGDTLGIVRRIETDFSALEATVSDLLHFASDREPDRTRFSVRDLIENICQSLEPQFAAQSIVVELDVDSSHKMEADANMIRRAVLNLVLNAVDAMTRGGELTVKSIRTNNAIEVRVADSGPGVADNARHRLFEPFFTTKNGGTGLGLAIVSRIAEVHGGEVACRNSPSGGAVFAVQIPNRQQEKVA